MIPKGRAGPKHQLSGQVQPHLQVHKPVWAMRLMVSASGIPQVKLIIQILKNKEWKVRPENRVRLCWNLSIVYTIRKCKQENQKADGP